MNSDNRPTVSFAPGEQRLIRYTVVSLSAVALMGTIVFVIWVLGQILGALHALVFPLAVAGVLALVLLPVVELFERLLRMSRLWAVITLFLILLALLVTILMLVVPTAISQGAQFFEAVPEMAERSQERLADRFPTALPVLEDALTGMEFGGLLPDAEEATERTMEYIAFVVGLGFVPLYLFFALLAGNGIKASAKSTLFLFTPRTQNDVVYLGQVFVDYVTAFFRGQLTIALIMGVIMAVGFTLLGLKAGIFFGLALGLLNIVPYLGFVVGLVTVLPVAYFQPEGGVQLVMLVLGVIAFTQIVETTILTPKIMADRSGLHPALVVISILFWGTALGGVVGMILAVPLTAFLLALADHFKTRINTTVQLDKAHTNDPTAGNRA